MSLALYMDHHVPYPVTRGLRTRGIDVLTAQEDGTQTAEDRNILQRATELGRLLFTQDEDFLAISAEKQRTGERFTGVAFAPQNRVTIGDCVRDLEMIAKLIERDEAVNQVYYLPLD